jgi:hypothetical protein
VSDEYLTRGDSVHSDTGPATWPVTATAIVAELGDARRFGCSDDAVRHCGLDVTVHQSDRKRAPGHLSHEGPELLRWALFEAAQHILRARTSSRRWFAVDSRTEPAASASCWTASKDRATANPNHGSNTRSIILSPDYASAHLGKAGRPRATQRRQLEHTKETLRVH